MEVGAEVELNVDNQEEECDEKKKKKRKLVRAHLKISKAKQISMFFRNVCKKLNFCQTR